MKVLVADPLHQEGLDLLAAEPDLNLEIRLKMLPKELVEVITEFDALIVRSESKVTAEVIEAGTKLRVVGRAGLGVDNIDLDAATRNGIAVVNAPTGNTIAAAEHTIAIMMSQPAIRPPPSIDRISSSLAEKALKPRDSSHRPSMMRPVTRNT